MSEVLYGRRVRTTWPMSCNLRWVSNRIWRIRCISEADIWVWRFWLELMAHSIGSASRRVNRDLKSSNESWSCSGSIAVSGINLQELCRQVKLLYIYEIQIGKLSVISKLNEFKKLLQSRLKKCQLKFANLLSEHITTIAKSPKGN